MNSNLTDDSDSMYQPEFWCSFMTAWNPACKGYWIGKNSARHG